MLARTFLVLMIPALAAPAAEGPEPKALEVSPAPAPTPAFRHRLFPLESERTPGDAAPVYLRAFAEQAAESRALVGGKIPADLLAAPMESFDAARAREILGSYGRRLEQFAFGARRQECDWSYSLPEERERAIEILLPDVQEMRGWARMLALKARVEIAEGEVDRAIRSIETGLAFSVHLGDGPFLINNLVGMAVATQMLERVEELIARPGSPNLYWALTALPRPLVSIRTALENEQKLGEWLVPEMERLDEPRSPAQWSALLERFHARMTQIRSMVFYQGDEAARAKAAKVPDELARLKGEVLDAARAAAPEGATDDQAVMLYMAGRYRELRDRTFQPSYLPYPEAAALYARDREDLEAAARGPLVLFAELLPSIGRAHEVQTSLARKVAALRAVEAIRMHAAANGGALPGTLEAVEVVPVPLDPMTGKPFGYRLDGGAAVLSAPDAPLTPKTGFAYRIQIREAD